MEAIIGNLPAYDRMKELKEFDETKAGVKGLVDSGIKQIPRFFIHAPEDLPKPSDGHDTGLQVPIIDLHGIADATRRKEIVEQVCRASESWGFFQLVNHGVPVAVIDEMVRGTRRFHEQDQEVKARFYTREHKTKVHFTCNFDLFRSPAASWRDTLSCLFDGSLDPEDLPSVCREVMLEYRERVVSVGDTVFELLSEGLGLRPDYIKSMNCGTSQFLVAHYYPPCPQPELTLGTAKHADPSFLTLLVQDELGGLQVLHQGKWVNVSPVHGALVVNIGDLLQIISNDRFKSVEHRVLASHKGPRISVAVFVRSNTNEPKPYGPIKELLSGRNPLVYQEVLPRDYIKYYAMKGLDGESALTHFKL